MLERPHIVSAVMPENSFERRVAAKQEDDETPVKRRVADDTAFERRVAAKREDVEAISECEVEYEGAVFYESPKSEQEHETSEPDESVKAEVDSEVEHEAKPEDDNATEIADLSNVADFLSKEVDDGQEIALAAPVGPVSDEEAECVPDIPERFIPQPLHDNSQIRGPRVLIAMRAEMPGSSVPPLLSDDVEFARQVAQRLVGAIYERATIKSNIDIDVHGLLWAKVGTDAQAMRVKKQLHEKWILEKRVYVEVLVYAVCQWPGGWVPDAVFSFHHDQIDCFSAIAGDGRHRRHIKNFWSQVKKQRENPVGESVRLQLTSKAGRFPVPPGYQETNSASSSSTSMTWGGFQRWDKQR